MKTAAQQITIAKLDIGYGVHFYKINSSDKTVTEYIVTYGQQVANTTDFKQAWEEFNSCCQHCLQSEGMID